MAAQHRPNDANLHPAPDTVAVGRRQRVDFSRYSRRSACAINAGVSQLGGTPSASSDPPTGASQLPDGAPPTPDRGGAANGTSSLPLVPSTRTGVVWGALGFSMLLLILILLFVLQNLSAASTTFFSIKWTIPLGLDLLLAALLGGLIVFLLGVARMLQLRRLARRYAHSQRRG